MDEAIRARLIRRMIEKHREDRMGAEVSSSSPAPDVLDKYDDSAVYGITDADGEKIPGPEDEEEENSQLDGFEKRRTEGKSFRARLKQEPADLPVEVEGGAEQPDNMLVEGDAAEFPSLEPLDGGFEPSSSPEARKSKKKKKKHRHHKKKRRHRRSGSPDGRLDEDSRLSGPDQLPADGGFTLVEMVKSEVPSVDEDTRAASEEGELETDEEIEQLVEEKRRKEEERAKKLKQLEILKRIAPDEYFLRLREMQEEEGYPDQEDEEEDRRSESSTENDPSMPWNDPNYGKANRARRSNKPEHVERPTNAMEVTNPAPQIPDF
jgi:hypothetical protein